MGPRAAWRLESLGLGQVYVYAGGKLDWFASGLPREGEREPHVDARVRSDVPTCALDERLGEVRERARAAGWDWCVVVNAERVVLGLLRDDAWEGDPHRPVEEAMEHGPSTFRPHLTVEELVDYLRRHTLRRTIITTSDGRLVGIFDREEMERRPHGHSGAAQAAQAPDGAPG